MLDLGFILVNTVPFSTPFFSLFFVEDGAALFCSDLFFVPANCVKWNIFGRNELNFTKALLIIYI